MCDNGTDQCGNRGADQHPSKPAVPIAAWEVQRKQWRYMRNVLR
jgi:hypothetical protein